MNKMTPEEVGWLVGIFDGEGSISIKEANGGRQQYAVAKVKMTDFDVILNLQKVTGIQGCLTEVAATEIRKAALAWQIAAQQDVVDLLEAMKDFPLLSERRKLRMEEALIVAHGNADRKQAKKNLQLDRFQQRLDLGHSEPSCPKHENTAFSITKDLEIQCLSCNSEWRKARSEVS